MGKSLIWDGEKAVEQDEPTLVWDGEKAIRVKKKEPTTDWSNVGGKASDPGTQQTPQSLSVLRFISGLGAAGSVNEKKIENDFDINPSPVQYESPSIAKKGSTVSKSFTGELLKSYNNTVKKGEPIGIKVSDEHIKMYADVAAGKEKAANDFAENVGVKAYIADLKPTDLQELYNMQNGENLVRQIVEYYTPGNSLMDEENKNWAEISRTINESTVNNRDKIFNDQIQKLNTELSSLLPGAIAAKGWFSGGTGGGTGGVRETPINFDTNDLSKYASIISELKESDGVNIPGSNLKPLDARNRILEMLDQKSKLLSSAKEMSKEILDLSGKTKNAITRVNIDRENGENIPIEQFAKYDEINQKHFEIGLNYIKDIDPGRYKNVVNAIDKKEKVADIDFRQLSEIGQQIENTRIFKGAVDDVSLIGKETELDYTTRQEKKSQYASTIGEYLKSKGYNNVREFKKSTIINAAKEIGLTNQSIINEIANEEGIMFYDAIPKTGWRSAVTRGIMTPFEGIRKTYNVIKSDDSDIYLQSQQFDVGILGQEVAGKNGQMGNRLASDRGNILYDALEGFGQFIPQIVLTRGIGSAISRTAGAAMSQVPRAALTAAQESAIVNYGGTFVSTYLQEYGSSYEDMLQKTGDGRSAKAAGAINGISAAMFEMILPDTKIASKFADVIRTSDYSKSLIEVIRKGGDLADLKRSGRDIIGQTVSSVLKSGEIAGMEMTEEMGTNVTNYITEAIFSPKTSGDRDLTNELFETAKATAVSMSIPALFGGIGSRAPKNFTVNSLHSAAIGIESYKNSLDQELIKESITQDEYDRAISVLNTHRESIKEAPKARIDNGKLLSSSEMLEYAYQETRIKEYKDQISKSTSDVKKEALQQNIDEAQNIQRSIIGGEIKGELKDNSWRDRVQTIEQQEMPVRTMDDIEQGYAFDVTEDEMKDASDFVSEMVDGEIIPAEFSEGAKKYPLTFLRNVAEQSQGYVTDENGNVVKSEQGPADVSMFGDTIVNYANKLFNFSKKSIDESLSNYTLPNDITESIDPILQRINDADYINEKELDNSADVLYDVLDSIDKSEMTDLQKRSAQNLIEPLINKLEQYEFRTTTKTVKTKQGKTTFVPKQVVKKEIKPALEQAAGSRVVYEKDGKKVNGLLKIENGSYVIYDIDGNKTAAIGDKTINDVWLSLPEGDDFVSFDEYGNVKSVKFITKDGGSVSIENSEKALDLAIQIRADQVGSIPDDLFDMVYEEFDVEVQEEVMVNNDQGVSGKATTLTVPSFGDRIAAGEQMSSPEDLQFYDNNKDAVEQYPKDKSSKNTGSLNDVESTTKALGEIKKDGNLMPILDLIPNVNEIVSKIADGRGGVPQEEVIAFAYHKAKADGTNPELVKAVEQFIKEQTQGSDLGTQSAQNQPQTDQGQPEQANGQNADQGAAETAQASQGAENAPEPAPGGQETGPDQTDQGNDGTQPPADKGDGAVPAGLNGELIGISHAATDAVAREFGLPEYEKDDPQSIEDWDNEADELLRNGYNVAGLLSRYKRGLPPSAVEQRIMLRYIANLKAKTNADPSNENLEKLKEAKQLSDVYGGRELARSLRARQGMRPVDTMTYADWLVDEMEDLGVDELLEVQKVKVKEEYEAIKAAHEALQNHANKLQEENARLKADAMVKEEARKSREANRQVKKQDLGEQRKKIVDDIRKKWQDASKGTGTLNALPIPLPMTKLNQIKEVLPDVIKLTRNLIEDGITDLAEIVDNIHGYFDGTEIDLDKKDIHDMLAGEYNEKKPLRSEVAAKLKDVRDEAAAINKLIALNNGIAPRNEKEHNERNRKIVELKKQISEHNLTQLNQAKTRMESQISKLEDQLAKGDFRKVEKNKLEYDEEGKKLEKKLIELRKKRDIRRMKNQYDKRTKREKIYNEIQDIINIPRSLMASTDFSAPLNQAIVATIGYPEEAKNAFAAMWKATKSQSFFDEYFTELKDDPRYDLMSKVKLGISDPQSAYLLAREEAFMSGYAERIPGVGVLVKGSERAYVMYLNKLRVDLFNKFIDKFEQDGKTYDNSKKLYEKTARYINNITGRGNLGKIEQFAPVFNALFFSPRLMASRIQLLNPFYFLTLPKELMIQYGKDMGKFLALGSSVLTLFSLYGKYVQSPDDEEERVTVELDPRSSDFAKIKQGKTRWNIWGGFQPYVRLYSQYGFNERKATTTGAIQKLDGDGAFGQTRTDLVLSFFRGKLAPVPSIIADITSGRNAMGEKITLKDEVYSHVLPLAAQAVYESWKEDGPSSLVTTAVPAIFGVGTQVYEPREKEFKNNFTIDGVKVKLPDDAFDQYQENARALIKEKLDKLKEVEGWKDLTPDEKVQARKAASNAAVKEALDDIKKSNPEYFTVTEEQKQKVEEEKALKKKIKDKLNED